MKDYLKALNNLNRQPLNIKTTDLKTVTPVKEDSIEDDESVKYKREPSPKKIVKNKQPAKYNKISHTAASIIQKYWRSKH